MSASKPDATDRLLMAWLVEGPDRGPEAGFERSMALSRQVRQRPAWTIPAWWLPAGVGTPMTRMAIVVVLLVLVAVAIAAGLAGGRREALTPVTPTPDVASPALPPPRVTVWLVIENLRSTYVGFTIEGGAIAGADTDAPSDRSGAGSVESCTIDAYPFEMSGQWAIRIDGEPVLTSSQPNPAYVGLAEGGEVTLRGKATEDGALQLSDLAAGAYQGSDRVPEGCSAFIPPDPSLAMPSAFQDHWRATIEGVGRLASGEYGVALADGYAEFHGPDGAIPYELQGSILGVEGDRVTFGPSPACPSPADYRWALSAADSTLTLTPVDDACAERRALLGSSPLLRYPGNYIEPGVRYVVGEFDPPIAFTVPADLPGRPEDAPGRSSHRFETWVHYWIPSLGWEIWATPERRPSTCGRSGSDWPTGADLDAYVAAFAEWDAAAPNVTIGEPRELTIAGRSAVAIDVIADAGCALPGTVEGDILERDFAVDVGDHLVVMATGPAVDVSRGERGAVIYRYDPALLEVGERFARSLELP